MLFEPCWGCVGVGGFKFVRGGAAPLIVVLCGDIRISTVPNTIDIYQGEKFLAMTIYVYQQA